MNIPSIEGVSNGMKPDILKHLVSLDRKDRYLRFCGTVSDGLVASYVSSLNFRFGDTGYAAILPDTLSLIGFIHVSPPINRHDHKEVEIGLSVDNGWRGREIGMKLMQAAIQHCEEFKYTKMYMNCLRDNAAMQRIARKLGLHVVVDANEAFAVMNIDDTKQLSIMDAVYKSITKE